MIKLTMEGGGGGACSLAQVLQQHFLSDERGCVEFVSHEETGILGVSPSSGRLFYYVGSEA